MLVPLLRSAHLGWIEKAVSVVELTMPPETSLVFVFLLQSVLVFLRVPDVLARQSYGLLFLIGFSYSVATLALLIQLASPFLLSFLPWRSGLSLLYLPYFAVWKMIVTLKARPHTWVPTLRETSPEVASARQAPNRPPSAAITVPPGGTLGK